MMNTITLSDSFESTSVLIDKAADPSNPEARIVAWPGRRIECSVKEGDIIIREQPGIAPQSYVLTGADLSAGIAEVMDVSGVIGGETAECQLHVVGPDGLLLSEYTIIRAGTNNVEQSALEAVLESDIRPIIRRGSRGPAVSEAQHRMNDIHGKRLAASQSPIDRCPLTVDGIFGSNTQRATVSFQRIAFPDEPREWDGVIGPKTWGELIERSEEQRPVRPRGRSPLNPSRWAPILRRHTSPRVHLRTGNAVRALIDGRDTFNAMAADMGATNGVRDFIYLLGWDNFDDFGLGAASNFRAIYTAAARRRVEIAAMLWDQPFLNWQAHLNATQIVRRIKRLPGGKAIEDDLTTNNTLASKARLTAALIAARINPRLIPVIIKLIEPDLARLGGSHHQKVLIVKRGERLVAYCGGIDMNPNRIRVENPNSGQPHHDTHCRIIGPSAHDLLSTFLSRWKHHPESRRFSALRGESEPVPSPIRRPSHNDAPFGGTTSVLIARTFNPIRRIPPAVVRERSIKPMLLDAISSSRKFIYCEDQYLIDLDTADALAAAINRLAHVTIVIPGNPISDLPFGKEYRRDFVQRILSRISSADAKKLGVFQLTTSQRTPTFGDHTYVHSKSWVFDDELAVIGTANCNRRSYTFDSEVNAFIFDDRPTRAGTGALRPTFAQQYRMALWQHHLTLPGRSLIDGSASGALWRRGRRPASARVIEFDHRLPTGSGRAGLMQAVMNRAANALRDLIDPVV